MLRGAEGFGLLLELSTEDKVRLSGRRHTNNELPARVAGNERIFEFKRRLENQR